MEFPRDFALSRPAVSGKRLSLTPNGNVRCQLKTAYRESLSRERSDCFGHGTTRVTFEPLDFIARLAALMPLCTLGDVPRQHMLDRIG